MGAQLECEVVVKAGRVAVRGINFRGSLYVGVEYETTSEDISRALVPFIYLVVKTPI